jgi:hypothetical protein
MLKSDKPVTKKISEDSIVSNASISINGVTDGTESDSMKTKVELKKPINAEASKLIKHRYSANMKKTAISGESQETIILS